jgi:hypothetical protein
MSWFLVYDGTTGEPVSWTSVVASPLPSGLLAVALPTGAVPESVLWDADARGFKVAAAVIPDPSRVANAL